MPVGMNKPGNKLEIGFWKSRLPRFLLLLSGLGAVVCVCPLRTGRTPERPLGDGRFARIEPNAAEVLLL